MHEGTRREFLKGALVVTAAAFVPVALHVERGLPILHGDGINDDTDALQAALDGRPYVVDGEVVVQAEETEISYGRFRVSRTLHVNRDFAKIHHSTFLAGDLSVLLVFAGGSAGCIYNCNFWSDADPPLIFHEMAT